MIGAIIGDLAGSIYEYKQFKKCEPVIMRNIIEDDAFFSDDTILTMAILDAVLKKKDYEKTLREYALKYQNYEPSYKPYFETIFSPNFTKWAKGEVEGKSSGNGAMMRISPVGYLFNSEEEIRKNVIFATKPSHNTKEAIDCALIVALIIFYSRQGYSKQQIVKKLNLKIEKPKVESFNYTCEATLPICLYSLFNANSFDEAIKLSLSFGGDTDTNACIVGSMAESMFGIDEKLKNLALKHLPQEFVDLPNEYYK